MAFRRNLLTMLLLLMLLAVQVYTEEECSDPNSIAEFTNTVIDAVCSMNDTTGESFRNQTRFSHGAGHKQDSECISVYYVFYSGIRDSCKAASSL